MESPHKALNSCFLLNLDTKISVSTSKGMLTKHSKIANLFIFFPLPLKCSLNSDRVKVCILPGSLSGNDYIGIESLVGIFQMIHTEST